MYDLFYKGTIKLLLVYLLQAPICSMLPYIYQQECMTTLTEAAEAMHQRKEDFTIFYLVYEKTLNFKLEKRNKDVKKD